MSEAHDEQVQLIRETVTKAFAGSSGNVSELTDYLTNVMFEQPNTVSVDFADFQALFAGAEKVYGGTGFAEGENSAALAAKEAVSRMDMPQSVKLKSIFVLVEHGKAVGLLELTKAVDAAQEICDDDTTVIWGDNINGDMQNAFRVIIFAA